MSIRQQLVSEKYWNQHVAEENERWRRARNRKAKRDFATFVSGLGAIALGVYLVNHTQQSWPDLSGLMDVVAKTIIRIENWLHA